MVLYLFDLYFANLGGEPWLFSFYVTPKFKPWWSSFHFTSILYILVMNHGGLGGCKYNKRIQ
jgi:hypothetical protein